MAIFPQLIELFQIKDPHTSSVQDCNGYPCLPASSPRSDEWLKRLFVFVSRARIARIRVLRELEIGAVLPLLRQHGRRR